MSAGDGAWIVYGWDMNFYGVVPFGDELLARRYADDAGEGYRVKFVPYGQELTY